VLRTRRRAGDAAEMSIVSLLEAAPGAEAPAEKGEKARARRRGREEGARREGEKKTEKPRRRPVPRRRREEGRAQEEVLPSED
jgi:hypothetical protein